MGTESRPPSANHETGIALRMREVMSGYWSLTDSTWGAFWSLCRVDMLANDTTFCRQGEVPTQFYFVADGLVRAFTLDEQGREYNRVFFDRYSFPGAMVALLTQSPSRFSLETLEPTTLVSIDFAGFRQLLHQAEDLKLFQIHYLERHWLMGGESRDLALIQQNATERYRQFLTTYPELAGRLTLTHIASHLGITPTQLSRIRKAEHCRGSRD